MGFEWARPTTFDDPMFTVATPCDYYAVDHSPSYLWNSATLGEQRGTDAVPPIVLAGPEAWDAERDDQPGDRDPGRASSNPAILGSRGERRNTPTWWAELSVQASASSARVSTSSCGRVFVRRRR